MPRPIANPYMTEPLEFASPWAERLYKLKWALNDNQLQLQNRLGLWEHRENDNAQEIARILTGGKVTPEFVVRLRSLEAQYAEELNALEKGLIKIVILNKQKHMWWSRDFRGQAKVNRPEDLAGLGEVGMARKTFSSGPPSKVVAAELYRITAHSYTLGQVRRSSDLLRRNQEAARRKADRELKNVQKQEA